MNISVISATYNRAKLLDNALSTYSKQVKVSKDDWEYILVDDMSTDETPEVAEKWKKKFNLRYMTSEEIGHPKDPEVWRDGCVLSNAASLLAEGRFLILTHPEILVPPDALFSMWSKIEELWNDGKRHWVTAIPYWMPKGSMPRGWKSDITKLTTMVNFYDPSWPEPMKGIDYRNQHQEVREGWESWVFNGIKATDWRWFGGWQEFTQWGSVDVDQANRRHAANIKTVFAYSDQSPHEKGILMVYHQNHESKRDADLAMQGVKGMAYHDAEQARKVGGLYNIYYSGPRERARNKNSLQGILGDHLERYSWAGFFSKDMDILDIPCGTGYGAQVLWDAGFKSYTGIDIDAESIEFAKDYYGHLSNVTFKQGDMINIPMEDASIDRLYCFEGIEHIENKAAFVEEMYRVIRPGGSFIISTPNPLVTNGTAWDKYMLTSEKLFYLFNDAYKWVNLDWFHQRSYSRDRVPVQPGNNTGAQIMILGGTRK